MITIKILTWNVGGGKILEPGKDVDKIASYNRDGFEHITQTIQAENPDIVTLQEVHKNEMYDLVEQYCKKLGYQYFVHDSTSPSHIDATYKLGHAIISKFPLSDHVFGLFKNPNLSVKWEDGSIAQSFDKGYSTVRVSLPETDVYVTTTHLVPFRRFSIDIDSPAAKQILSDVDNTLSSELMPYIITGDFNINRPILHDYLPNLLETMDEICLEYPTTPKGRMYDHILFRGASLTEHHIASSVKTDHFPVVAEFKIN